MQRNLSYNLSNLSFLVVDDNKNMRLLIIQVMHALGIREIKEAEDGSSALKALKTFPIDIVICDWNMEPLDGIDFTRTVRTASDSPNPFVPIIMLTGHTEMSRVEEARDAGVHEFLAKPISAKSLYQRIVSVVEVTRNFIRSPKYTGPDRRRSKGKSLYMGPERRKQE
ncbi:MAG: response regulator [Rhodospirillales bacterium]